MREYKFRGKRIDNGEWITGCLIQDNYGVFILKIGSYLDNMKRVYPETVEQAERVPELENENKKLKEKIRELKEELNGE